MQNNENFSKCIEMHLINGNPDSLVVAELSNWDTAAIRIPRNEINACKDDHITKPGVYFLICKENDNSLKVYIGETNNIKTRLKKHIKDYDNKKEDYYWIEAIAFVNQHLSKDKTSYLEMEFVRIAKECKRAKILTKNTNKNVVIKDSIKNSLQEFIFNAKIVLNMLGYKILQPVISDNIKTKNDVYFHLKGRKADAAAVITNEGFVVLKGSTISKEVTKSFLKDNQNKKRQMLFDEKIIKDFKFTKDYIFNSPSEAASILNGNSTNGQRVWLNKDGKSFGSLNN